MTDIITFEALPKSYFFDIDTRNLYFAHISYENKKIQYKNKIFEVLPNSINFIDTYGNFISIPYNSTKLKKVSAMFGIFKLNDKNKSILNLKTLIDYLISLSIQENPEPKLILILGKNNEITKLEFIYYPEDKYKLELDVKNLLNFFSLIKKTL